LLHQHREAVRKTKTLRISRIYKDLLNNVRSIKHYESVLISEIRGVFFELTFRLKPFALFDFASTDTIIFSDSYLAEDEQYA
jgi:hypothetical protein